MSDKSICYICGCLYEGLTHFCIGTHETEPPPTARSRDICECAALRQQLRLADELAAEAQKMTTQDGHRIPGVRFKMLRVALKAYSEARIQAEVATPDVEEQVARR
jgi:hypothetical protein